mgnify:CR=1 FL=1
MTKDQKIAKLGKEITDRATVLLGKDKITPNSPEYLGINSALKYTAYKYDQKMADDILDICLTMKKRVPLTIEQLAAKNPQFDRAYLEKAMQAVSESGLVEFHWENLDGKNPNHEKRWVLDMFVPGSAEIMMINPEQSDMYPETADFFERMAYLPLAGITELVPPGGAGIGMHVIPVEKAIPAESKSLPIEHLSHWLKKYEGHIGVSVCSCRKQQRIRGEGSGDIEGEWCIGVGDFADYCRETNHGRDITYEEAMEILQKAEDKGYVHQITNIDGENKIFGICNCAVGVCNALRTSQLFNTPNMSASAYRAHVDKEKCVACGKCVEVCPAGAAKLGQKLCTKDGPVVYPKQPLPDDNHWGEHMWDMDYKNNNQKNCHESGTAPCKAACPAHIAVQGYIKMAGQGRYLDALKLIKQDNPFPAVCGSICNRRCEDACTRGQLDRAVAIDEIKKFIAEKELSEKTRYIPEKRRHKTPDTDYVEKIAIIGAGPAGMSCAYYLAEMGYANVTVFDRNPVPGGMLTLGIPSFRLERKVINAEIDVLKKMGVKFKCGVEVGKDITIDELRKQGYKGFFVAIGAQKSAKLGITGEELKGVYGGVDFLRDVNLGNKVEIGKKVAVIGGGNVSMDATRTAKRLGAESVTCVYRRRVDDMTALAEEIEEAMAEGCQILPLQAPARIEKDAEGKVAALWTVPQIIGPYGKDGRPKPIPADVPEFRIACDYVIVAIGQAIDARPFEAIGIKTFKGMIQAEDTSSVADVDNVFAGGDAVSGPATVIRAIASQEGIFAGGDCVSGPASAIKAIAAGKVAAANIDAYLGFEHKIKTDVVVPPAHLTNAPPCGRVNLKSHCTPDCKGNFDLVVEGMSRKEADQESERCLRCDYFGFGSFRGGRTGEW